MSEAQENTALECSNSTQDAGKKRHEIIIGDRVRVIGGPLDGEIGVVSDMIAADDVEVTLKDGRCVFGEIEDFEVFVPDIDLVALQRQLCKLRKTIDRSAPDNWQENIEPALGRIMLDFFDIRWQPPHKGRWWPRGFEV